jgi:two-component system LytT family response regulator
MTPLSAIIIDDEQHSISALQWELEGLKEDISVIRTTTLPAEGLKFIRELQPDIIFLDIEMPGMNGFELIQQLEHIRSDIIFTTAYDGFALKAFEIDATDYLLKPVSEEALVKSIAKVKERRKNELTSEHLGTLLQKLNSQYPEYRKIALPTLGGLLFIRVEEISHCSSDSNYTHVYSIKGDRFLISKTLKEIEHLIQDDRFLRVHHSHLINMMHIREYHKGKGGSMVMEDGSVIPVAKNRKKELLDKF